MQIPAGSSQTRRAINQNVNKIVVNVSNVFFFFLKASKHFIAFDLFSYSSDLPMPSGVSMPFSTWSEAQAKVHEGEG